MTNELVTDNDNFNLNKEIIKWGCKYLSSNGYKLKSNLPEEVQNTPWSYVIRFATTEGHIYLKATPALLALEAQIIQILADQFHASVPEIIACNNELNCFLMKDAGKPLREILKEKFDEALLRRAIDQFTSLQVAVADHIDVFLSIGVPDWRLNKLPDLFDQLLSQKDFLIADGLTEREIIELEELNPVVSILGKKLSSYEVKETIVQPDFNDANTLIDGISQNITIIDLGEIAISHPFFSLLNFLHQIKKHYALTNEDDSYHKIKEACFKRFMNIESKNQLLEAIETAQILFFIYAALGNYRLMIACNKAKFTPPFQRHGRPSVPLKEFMIACIEIDKE